MPAYEGEGYLPAAPVARVTCRNPETGAACSDIPMLLDTGADVTLLPRSAAERVGLVPLADQQYELLAFDGGVSTAPIVLASVVFLGRVFRGKYLLIDQECGIIGRNILNTVPLLLNGPGLVWDEHRPRT